MSRPAFDPLRAFRTLEEYGVRFVVIGGVGSRLHGSPTVTNYTDICYERTPENLERLARALRSIRARLRGLEEDGPFVLDEKTLAAGDHFTFTTQAGALDCLGTPSGVSGFEQLAARAVPFDVDGLTVLVASLDDLIAMKRAAGRPKDLIEVEVLEAVRAETEESRDR
ncbi:MAG TPA: hypothetical protein VJO36_06360 [Actinomycetota bacterium]|nr:hypothetical protein [Actinomycetota bacterium]